MASNVSNLLKEKIVTPVANSVAAQVDNKVKNGIILRKFIGVQLGESNTGCQLVKIDLNKINVKDPSYEFTLYIKAFSQKGLFNFIVNVNKTDSLQVDVKCEVKNSDSSNGEVIGYYDVDAVGNTITVSLVKDFVVNTSINECKFVSTKDTLNISDLDIDWSDTGNIKTSTSINIRYNQTSIYEYDEYFYSYKPDFADGEMYQIAKFDFSELLNKTLTGNKNFNISIDIIYHSIAEFHICLDLSWMRNLSMINMIKGTYEKITFQSSMERRNFDELFKFCRKDNTTLLLLINPPEMYISGGKFVIRRIEVHRADADIESDLVKIDLTPEKLVNSDGSLVIGSIQRHKASIPAPTDSEISNGYYLKADGTWGAASNEINILHTLDKNSILENEAYVLGKMNFSKLIDYDFESNPIIVIKVELTSAMVGNITLNFRVQWNATGKKIGISLTSIHTYYNSFSITDSEERISVLKTSKLDDTTIAICYNPDCFEAIIGTKEYIIIHSFESYVQGETLKNIVSASWSLEKIDTTLNKLQNISTYDVDFYRVFQASDLKNARNNGLVPHPTGSEAENKYLLGADAKWHPRKAGNEYIANLKPTAEILELTETDITKGVSFVTIDFNTLSQKIVEATPSTYQEFDISMEILVRELGIISINASFSVTTAGVIACTGVFSNRGLKSVNFSITFDSKIGSTPSPGFFVNDYDTKIFKLALYTVFANNGVKIIDAQITSFSDLISENDITFTWELGVLDKLPAQIGRSAEIYLGVDLPRNQTFRQMNIETPITETEETVVEAERLKYNGLVPAPGKYEVNNKYLLGADGNWHPRKIMNDSFIDLEPDDAIKGLNIEDGTKAVSFVTFDFNNIVTKLTELSQNSTKIHFEMELETTGNLSIDYHINGSFMVNKSGLIPTTVFTSPLTKNSNLNGYLENPSALYNEVIDTPGFYIMDPSLKTVTFALYTVLANSTVRIKDFYIHVDESVISLEDLTIEWKLLTIDKPEWAALRVQKFKNGSLIPPTRIFEQMDIETPIDEADSFTLGKERVENNGLVPAPGKYEVDNGYVLGADAKWHPRKAGNEYIANLKPTEEIKGLSETDTTKGISFVTFDFNSLSQKVVEAAPSTMQEFMIDMKVLTCDLGIITISTRLSVTTAGLVACSGVLSDRGMGRNTVSFSTTYSAKLGAVTSPGFFVNDRDTKIFKIALYTPIAINGVKIIDVIVTSYSDIIDESDIVFTWELGILEKKPYKPLTSNIIYPRIDLDRELVFDQMNIETPISETDEDTLFAEQIKHNGLVPAPGKYEVNNGYYLKADGTWDLPKRQVQDAIATVTPTSEMISQVEAAKTTKLISFLTIDVNEIASTIEKTERFNLSMDVLTAYFGLVRIGFTIIINTRGFSNISNFNSDLGTDMLPVQLTRIYNLKDYGVETMSPIFGISDSSNKGIFNIGINGSSMRRKVIVLNISCIPGQNTLEYKPFKYIFEPTLIDLDSSATIQRFNSSLIGSMDPSNVFGPITEITSEEIANETDPYDLKMKKLRKNGLVPAPYQYEVDQGRVLCADGTWSSANDIMTSITTNPEDEGKVLKAHNGSVIWATLINGEEVGY